MFTVSKAWARVETTCLASSAAIPVRRTADSSVSPERTSTWMFSGRVKPGWASAWVKALFCRAAKAAASSGLGACPPCLWPSVAVRRQPAAKAARPATATNRRGVIRNAGRRGSKDCIVPPKR